MRTGIENMGLKDYGLSIPMRGYEEKNGSGIQSESMLSIPMRGYESIKYT